MDYRYFPDPDLPPLLVSGELLEEVRGELPELPAAAHSRLLDVGLASDDASALTADQTLLAFFDEALAALGNDEHARLVASWILVELQGLLNKESRSVADSPVSASALAELVGLIADDTISGKIAKKVLPMMLESGERARTIVDREGLVQITDTGAIEAMIDEIVAANPKQVEQYRGGNEKLLGFFVGQVMQKTQGQANPKIVNQLLRKKLEA